MPRKFTIDTGKDPKALLKEVRKAAAANGVEFEGDETAGKFEGKVSGRYSVEGSGPWKIRVTLTAWPWYVGGEKVETMFREYFGE